MEGLEVSGTVVVDDGGTVGVVDDGGTVGVVVDVTEFRPIIVHGDDGFAAVVVVEVLLVVLDGSI